MNPVSGRSVSPPAHLPSVFQNEKSATAPQTSSNPTSQGPSQEGEAAKQATKPTIQTTTPTAQHIIQFLHRQGSQVDQSTLPPFVNPANRSIESQETRALAYAQTIAARKVLYFPGKTLRREMGQAASQLYKIVTQLSDAQVAALGARLLGSQGLLSGCAPKELVNILNRVKDVEASLSQGRATATDRAAFLEIMSSMGSLYLDPEAKLGVETRTKEQAEDLRNRLTELIKEQGLSPITQDVVNRVRNAGSSSAVGPQKKKERVRPPNDKPPRAGVHDLGDEVDSELGIDQKMRLPKIRWDVAHISTKRVSSHVEPLVGHMSGSLTELLTVWDMLSGHPGKDLYTGVLDAHRNVREQETNPTYMPMEHLSREERNARHARVAGACAMIIGCGYHGAVELAEGVLLYTGQNLRDVISKDEDAAHLLGNGAATELICELLKNYVGEAR
ncbi:MAG TPA: hypothetical protein VM571_08445 [Noviherbaspirillum sp.]|nr:hypothetical protein [Noviherbaspirillum sp.]